MGDILTDVEYVIFQKEAENDKKINEILVTYPYSIVLTQDCDLEQDYGCRNTLKKERNSEDKLITSILLCPVFNAADFKSGQHLSDIGLISSPWGGELWSSIKSNNHKRFYFLNQDSISKLPDLIIDFKNFFTISSDSLYDVYEEKHCTSVKNLFREDISHRFAHYNSRIGLPKL